MAPPTTMQTIQKTLLASAPVSTTSEPTPTPTATRILSQAAINGIMGGFLGLLGVSIILTAIFLCFHMPRKWRAN